MSVAIIIQPAEILANRGNHTSKVFSGEIPQPPYERATPPLVLFPETETVSIVLRQCSVMDMQVPPVPNQPKTAEIQAQNASKMHYKCK